MRTFSIRLHWHSASRKLRCKWQRDSKQNRWILRWSFVLRKLGNDRHPVRLKVFKFEDRYLFKKQSLVLVRRLKPENDGQRRFFKIEMQGEFSASLTSEISLLDYLILFWTRTEKDSFNYVCKKEITWKFKIDDEFFCFCWNFVEFRNIQVC